MRARIEAIANLAVIVVALAVGYVVLARYMGPYRALPAVAAGDRLTTIPGLDWSQHRRTLLLALNTDCHYCQDSVPFYQTLAGARHPGRDLEVVAVFPNEAEAVRRFVADEGLSIRSVTGVSLESLHVSATPTLMLVDSEGRVERIWIGILTPRQEIDLLKEASGS